jgi:hypothetical protein
MNVQRTALVAVIAAAGVAIAAAPSSDPTGVYAIVDRVVLEPDTVNPQRIQVWGVFAVARPCMPSYCDMNAYLPAERGYLYFVGDGTNLAVRAQWADLRAVAGTGEPIAFGGRRMVVVRVNDSSGAVMQPMGRPRVRPAREAPANPEPYNTGIGIVRLAPSAGGVVWDVMYVPAPVSPADGDQVPPGRVKLVTRNIGDPAATYVFEIHDARGQVEMSPSIRSGTGTTAWTPKLEVRAGEEYTWRVRSTSGVYTGQAATSTFRVRM